MFCPSCGNEIKEGENFCGKCGYVVKQKTPVPNQEKVLIDEKKPNSIEKRAIEKQLKHNEKVQLKKQHRKETHFKLKLILSLIAVFVLIFGTLAALSYFNVINLPFISSVSDNDKAVEKKAEGTTKAKSDEEIQTGNDGSYEVPTVDADEYFNENATVIEKIAANSLETVETESEVISSFSDRGFTEAIIYNYDMDGNYSDDKEAEENDSKHPMYQSQYITQDGSVWYIIDVAGNIMAVPFSYNYANDKYVVLSEKETTMSYDSASNQFYEIKPNDMEIIKVDNINAQTLEDFNKDSKDKTEE